MQNKCENKVARLLPIESLETEFGCKMSGWKLQVIGGCCSGKRWRCKRFDFICLIRWLLELKPLGSAFVGMLLVSRNSMTLFWDEDSTKGLEADARLLLWKTATAITGFGLWSSVIHLGVRCSVVISVSYGDKKPMQWMSLRRRGSLCRGHWQHFKVLELEHLLPVKAMEELEPRLP